MSFYMESDFAPVGRDGIKRVRSELIQEILALNSCPANPRTVHIYEEYRADSNLSVESICKAVKYEYEFEQEQKGAQ